MVSHPLTQCRSCSSPLDDPRIDLGNHALSGVFPRSEDDSPPSAPLRLSLCARCGLVQLADHVDLALMYNDDYGYRSSINETMRHHLEQTAETVYNLVASTGSTIRTLDIGSNDGTLMNRLRELGALTFGCDPSISPADADLHSRVAHDFFSARIISTTFGEAKFDLITSIAMLYDLPDPKSFFRDIKKCLSRDGIWFFEQTDLRALVDSTAFDSICHEHTEYYSFAVLKALVEEHGMEIRRVWRTTSNGSSVACVCTHNGERLDVDDRSVAAYLKTETTLISDPASTLDGMARIFQQIQSEILETIRAEKDSGRQIIGLGASTKGNTLIQTLGLTAEDISFILDRAPFKHGRFTPGSKIPVFDEALVDLPDEATAIVFPWHFRDQFLIRYANFRRRGGRLLFPLPKVEVI